MASRLEVGDVALISMSLWVKNDFGFGVDGIGIESADPLDFVSVKVKL